MFRASLCPSSGAHDNNLGYHIGRLVFELLLVGSKVQVGWMSVRTEGFGPDTHPFCLHFTSNKQQLENQTAFVVTNAIVVSS